MIENNLSSIENNLSSIENNLSEKLKVLGIDSNQLFAIENYTYKPLYLTNEELNCINYQTNVFIDLNLLVGVNRMSSTNYGNWLGVLDSLHKMRNFNIFTKEDFSNIILNPPQYDNPPQVICLDGEYYIDAEGKHRLTIAKCLGFNQAKVNIKQVTKKDMD